MKNVNRHINNVDYWQADILSAYDYSPFGVMLSGRTFEKEETVQICHDSTTLTTLTILNETFDTWFTWTTMGSALLTYVDGGLQISNPNNSKKDIGTSKTFTTGTGVHAVSFDITDNSCANIQLWPPAIIPVPIDVKVRDNSNNVVVSGSYTTAGNYNLSFTPVTTGATYKIEFYMTGASAFCYFAVDNVLITYQDADTVQVCENVSKKGSYPRGFNGQLKDNEISGKGNSYTAEFWQYSSRLGRRWNIDPVFKEYESPYATFGNNPIWFVDPNGADTSFSDNQVRKDFMTAYNQILNRIQSVQSTVGEIKSEFDNKLNEFNNGNIKKIGNGFLKTIDKKLKNVQSEKRNLFMIKGAFDYLMDPNTSIYEFTSDVTNFEKVNNEKSIANGLTTRIGEGEENKIRQYKYVVTIRPGHDASVIHELAHCVEVIIFGRVPSTMESEENAFTWEQFYDPKSVNDFIEGSRNLKYQWIEKDKRPSMNLQQAIKYIYEEE